MRKEPRTKVSNCISYIVPTYNGQNYIRKTIASIHNGNFECGDEVIIIDDHSNDETINIAKELLKDQKIDKLILLEKNIGEGLAKNTAIKKIKNNYFFCLDQDNLLAPPVYSRPVEFRGIQVPPILLSGDPKKIDAWRQEQALERTQQRRPDILDQ